MARIVSPISRSRSQPSSSAPREITSREHPAAKFGVLNFFLTDLSSRSITLLEGRISATAAAVGTLLGIKPIITCSPEGSYIVAAKPRGIQNSLKKLLELAQERAGDRPAWICLQSGNGDPKQMDMVRATLQERLPNAKIVLEKQINASLAVHTGPGLIGIAMLTDVT